MIKIVKENLVMLPRPIRLWWGKVFIYMLGRIGTDEFYNDMILHNELNKWVKTNGRPTTSNVNYHINK